MKHKRKLIGCGIPLLLLIVLGYFAWPFLSWFEPWALRKLRFGAATKRAAPLVEAIKHYESDNGRPPASLEALVPKYITRIPRTGMRDYPTFEYNSYSNSRASLVWYDLGSRHGKPMSGLWVYIDGDPEHAILAFTLDQSNVVVNARVDRMPESYDPIEFNVEKWNLRTNRIEMVRALPERHSLKGTTLPKLENLLGPPDGTRELRNTPWELRIPCSWGFLNWDVFLYWPTEKYPEYTHGGSTEMIGKWCYVHE